ncbi:MAG: precorrin-8X methylmutase [Clostridia bacterium]|nr:precorrin-8X methylmutase [Clostridia bacterium]
MKMKIENINPNDIERISMQIIESELADTSHLSESEKLVVKRVIHATADFEYLNNLKFSENAADTAKNILKQGAVIVTDTQMAFSGISKPALKKLGCEIYCFMSDSDVAETAKNTGTTRAAASVDKAAEMFPDKKIIFVVGNAPTALIRICELAEIGRLSPSFVVGTPVGFVNVVQSKNMIMQTDIPYIVADGRKGGSTVAAAVCNALLYQLYDRKTGEIIN